MSFLSDSEKERANQFIKEHKSCGWFATEGAKYTYHLTPTGLGTIVKIECNCCNSIRDISDELG